MSDDTFWIDYNTVGISFTEQMKADVMAKVAESPLADELEWVNDLEGRSQGVVFKSDRRSGGDVRIYSQRAFVVTSDDCVEALTGKIGSDWHRLVIELLLVLSDAKSRDGSPVFTSNGWQQVMGWNVEIPEGIARSTENEFDYENQ